MEKKEKKILLFTCLILAAVGMLIGWLVTWSINDVSRAEAIEKETGEPPRGSFSYQNHTFDVTIATPEQLEAWRYIMIKLFIPYNNRVADGIVSVFNNLLPDLDTYIKKGESYGPKRAMTAKQDIAINTKKNIQDKCDEWNRLPWNRYPTDWDSYWGIATSTLTNDIADGIRDATAMKISVNLIT